MFVQMPLKIELRDEAAFETFVSPSEQVAVALHHFQQSLGQPSGEAFYLFGSASVGKTHLLQAACRYLSKQGKQTVYFPLADEHLPLIPDVLIGLEQVSLICLDDVDRVIGDASWELALSSLLSKAAIAGHQVVLSGHQPMETWQFATTELNRSVLNVLPIALTPLTEPADLVLALQKHAERIGLQLPKEVGRYLVKQFSEDVEELLSVLQLLAQQSLVAQRRLTLPFVKQVLKGS